MVNPSDVTIDLYDLNGRKVATVLNSNLQVGAHECLVDFAKLGLATANYMYQIEVKNGDGLFKDVKMMTAVE